MFDRHRNALAVGGTPWLGLEGGRNLADGQAFEFLGLDLSGENLSVFFSLAPGRAVLTQNDVTITTTTLTWAEALTKCNERRKPCDVELTDTVVVSTVNISWTATTFTNIPEANVPNDVVPLYLELRRTDDTGPRIAGGVFYLTETNLNGDT